MRTSRSASAREDRICGAIHDDESMLRVELLAWLTRLRYLNAACENPLLQSIALSVWGQSLLAHRVPTLRGVVDSFRVSLSPIVPNIASTPLLQACRAARLRRGDHTDLALCFVALCRAVGLHSRLVYAFDLCASPKKSNASVFGCATGDEPEGAVGDRFSANGELAEALSKLTSMGYEIDAARAALLDISKEGLSTQDYVKRAVGLLLQYGCQRTSRTAQSSEEQSNRCNPSNVRTSDKCTSAKSATGPTAREAHTSSRASQMSVWPEVFDNVAQTWVAIDIPRLSIAVDPRIEWMYRGTPMLWVVSAIGSNSTYSFHGGELMDVTSRYSANWSNILYQRGSKEVNDWWTSIFQILAGKLDTFVGANKCTSDTNLTEDEATARMHLFRNPSVQMVSKLHQYFVFGKDVIESADKVLCRQARPVTVLNGKNVYWRKDLVTVKTHKAWALEGRQVQSEALPCKHTSAPVPRPLYAIWQTQPKREAWSMPQPQEEPTGSAIGAASPREEKVLKRPYDEWLALWREAAAKPQKQTSVSGPQASPKPLAQAATKQTVGTNPYKERPRPQSFLAGMQAKVAQRKHHDHLQNFEDWIVRLQSWLRIRGHYPWEKSYNTEERELGRWVTSIREKRARLTPHQMAQVEGMHGWAWQPRVIRESSSDEESSDDDLTMRLKAKRRRVVESEEEPSADDGHNEEEVQELWVQFTLQQLIKELASQPDIDARRLCVRRWQLQYHPDKNPGRNVEVLPIFRWVQSLWDAEFRHMQREPDADCTPPRQNQNSTASGPIVLMDEVRPQLRRRLRFKQPLPR